MARRIRPQVWQGLLVASLLVQLLVLYDPSPPGLDAFPGVDKVGHLAVFAAPALFAVLIGVRWWLVAGLLAGHALVSELIQHFLMLHRSGDPLDLLADFAGITLGVVLGRRWAGRHSG